MNPITCGSGFLISSSHSKLAVLTVLFVLAIGVGLPQISAEIFGISLDKTCLAYLKNNLTTSCPTYEEIQTLFPDTSNTKISGDFGFKNGIYQRLPTQYINHFEYYRHGDRSQLFIDPPGDIRTKINLIEIKANLKEYKLPKAEGYNNADHSLTVGVGRYVDKRCSQASVDSSNWIFLIGDTIKYMNSNCDPSATNYNSTKKTYLDKVTHDITTSYKWRLEQWQKESILKCGYTICLYVQNQTAPP